MKSKIKIRRRRRRQSRSQKGLMTWTAALHARQQMNRRGVEANHPKTPSSPEILVERGISFTPDARLLLWSSAGLINARSVSLSLYKSIRGSFVSLKPPEGFLRFVRFDFVISSQQSTLKLFALNGNIANQPGAWLNRIILFFIK